ncbi:hypothetical protein PCN89_02720 [Streptococcus suis]|uniref:hypothetical protein n=1 Tax=Streptococcus suis TaxID=1307 RepID=UPI002874B053|nr:hypothetical protein [Streptococcus suis]MDS1367904.1 hypothetical protein [Streptococcus suis]
MELEFIWRLAHQLDKETFFEVYDLLDNTIEVGASDNLFDLLEKKRVANLQSYDEFSIKFGITKQGYYQWRAKGSVPEHHVRKAAELIGISLKEANNLNFRKEYGGSNVNSIKLLERRRIELGIGKKEFSKLLNCDLVTYRNWRNAGKIPEHRIKDISETLEIDFDLLVEANYINS